MHADETAHLRRTRSLLVRAPHVRMLHLTRLDTRIAAHLDGLNVSGAAARETCVAALAELGVGELFAAASWALAAGDAPLFERLLAVAESVPEAEPGLFSALGWASASTLRDLVRTLLVAPRAFHRQVGLAACAQHRVDPAAALTAPVGDANARLRACALKTAGKCGRADLLPATLRALADDDERCRNEAEIASLLLGDRGRSVAVICNPERSAELGNSAAFQLMLMAVSPVTAAEMLRRFFGDAAPRQQLISAVGLVGDPHYVPWLIAQMSDDRFARLAGESFTLITGVHLAEAGMEDEPPEGHAGTPNDNPEDNEVGLDPDDNLPWPHRARIEAWWQANGERFPRRFRSFMGAPVTREHCIDVLKSGYQRQRILAAHHLRLLEPGTPLFNTSAPAWRQQRLLAKME